nr:phage tail tape measure protein [uncultured Mediterranean phage uvMED]
MAYRAEIEIVAKGVTKVTQLQKGLNQLAKQIDHLNGPGSLKDFNGQLAQAKKLLDRAQQGTVEEKRAVDKYVTALKNANTAQVRTNKLIAEEIRQRDGATASLKRYNAAAASARQPGGSMAGRYVRPGSAASRTQFSSPIGPKPGVQFGSTTQFGPTPLAAPESIFRGQSSAVEGRVKRILEIKKGELQLEKALIGLQEKSRGLDAASIADNNRILDIKAKEVSRNNEIIRQEKVRQSILRKRQRLEAAGRGPGGSGGGIGKRKFTDIATGAGFPLLFGGGPIQALAGGLGGAAGGLGGAIAASAITAQVEAFAKEAAKVGQALNSTSGALELVREKSLFSKEAIKERAFELEEQGRVEELAALLTGELTQLIGNEGVRSLQELGKTTSETTKLWNQLTTQLFELVSGPLNAFLKVVNQVLGAVVGAGSREAFFGDLGSQEGAARSRFKVLTGESLGTGRSGSEARAKAERAGQVFLSQEDALAQIRKEFKPVNAASIPVTAQDRRDFSVSGGRAKKGRESRLPQLQAEVALQERLAVLSRQVVKAKEEENPVREAALNMEIALEKQATAIDKINLEKITAAEKLEKTKLVELATDEKILAIKDKVKAAEASRAEKASETMDGLQQQKDLLEARLNGTEEEVALKQELDRLTKDMTPEEAARTEQLLRGVAATEEQVKALEKLESMYTAIGQSISSGIVDALSAAVEGTKSLADVASQTLRQVANILLQFGVNTALGGIPGLGSFFGGGRAAGGPVSGGTPYMVGEKGPELFVPNTSGTIVPNNKLGGGGATNVVVNVDAKGSSASGDSGAGKQLGGLIGAAVQAELIKQQRPGGLLSR